jgi:hypothetical protein
MNFYKRTGDSISLGKYVKFRDFSQNEEKRVSCPKRNAAGKVSKWRISYRKYPLFEGYVSTK